MEKTNQYSSGVRSILSRARQYNHDIGDYMEHYVNERFAFTVRLSNGRIELPMEMAQDQEAMPSSISEDRIKTIASRFQSNNPRPVVIPKSVLQTVTDLPKPLTFWQKLLKVLGLK